MVGPRIRDVALSALMTIAFGLPAVASDGGPEPVTRLFRPTARVDVLLFTPQSSVGAISTSVLMDTVSAAWKADTDLEPRWFDQKIALECQGLLACILEKVQVSGQARDEGAARFLVLLSKIARGEAGDRVSGVLVDVEAALAALKRVDPKAGDPLVAREDAIGPHAVRAKPVTVTTAAQLESYAAAMLSEHFRSSLERHGHWRPFGSIQLVVPVAGLAVLIDGDTVAVTHAGAARIEGVLAGRRTLSLTHSDYEPSSTTVQVRPGETTRVELPVRSHARGRFRRNLLWTGAGAAVAGASLVATAAALSSSAPSVGCIRLGGNSEPCRTGPGELKTFQTVSGGADPNPRGVSPLPIGIGLLALSTTYLSGALLADADSESMSDLWWVVGIGVAVFAGSVATAHALDGKLVFKTQSP